MRRPRVASRTILTGFLPPSARRWLASLLAVLLTAGPAWSLPNGAVVVSGNATVSRTGPSTLQVVQVGGPVVIQWRSFSIGAGELVRFLQPGPASLAVNRVGGGNASVILGQLLANGQIVLINPGGITVGAGGLIKVAGLVATTLALRDVDLRAGRLFLEQDPGQLATILNQGTITVVPGGVVALVAPGVINRGTITAELGSVHLASGRQLIVDFAGDGLVRFAVDGALVSAPAGPDARGDSPGVRNEGRIRADGGLVELSARTAGDVLTGVVNNSGIVEARSLVDRGGVVRLIGGDDAVATATANGALRPVGEVRGIVSNTGSIDVSAREAGAAPGRVLLVGERVGHGGTIDARGAEGSRGGEVSIATSERSVLLPGSAIDVSGGGRSSAGRVTIWSDGETTAATGATILARGGEGGGHGGFVEVSAGAGLSFDAVVDARAPAGATGTLLLDPRNITVRTAAGVAYNPGVNNLFGNNVGATTVITPASINAAAANVILQANSDITVTDPIAMANAGVGLTMDAGRSITVNANVATNSGPISLTSNSPGALLADRAAGAGNITMALGTTINAGSQPISLSVGGLVGGNPGNITARDLTSSAGGILLSTPNTITLNGVVNAGAGPVTIQANTDGVGAQNFLMNAGSSIATTSAAANAVAINVNAAAGGTGTATVRDISTGPGGIITVRTDTGGNLTGGAITQSSGTLSSDGILLSSPNTVTLNGVVNAGAGPVTIQANTDGTGAQNFAMAAGSTITTTNASAGAVAINVNAAGGGTGVAALGGITTGSGGTIAVATNSGGNTTGGSITRAGGTLGTGAGSVVLTTPTTGTSSIGTAGVRIQTASGSVTATAGSGGIFVTEADGASFQATAAGAGQVNLASTGGTLTLAGPTSTGSGAITLASGDAVMLNANVGGGSGTITINANTNGAGAEGFTQSAGATITTTNASVNAVRVNVNAAAGGTGGAALGSISSGSGGRITATSSTGGNATGGSITQTPGDLLNTGTGSVVLSVPTAGASGIGAAGAEVRTTAGTVIATAGSGGVFITETDGANFTATATGAGPISLASTTGTLTIAGATSTGTGPIAISGGAIVQNANLTTGGPITVTAAAGPITMVGGAQSTAGGDITYQAAGDITLRLLTSGAAAGVTSTGGSILDGNAAALNVSAGTTTALQAGGVIGTPADPLEIAVVGLANVNANGAQSGVSVNINGTTGDNTLHFPLTVPGQIFFNGVLLFPIAPPVAPGIPPPAPVGLQGASFGVFEQAIASCELSTGMGALVRLPTACRPGVSAKQEPAAPLPELGESP